MKSPTELAAISSAQSRDLHCLAPPREAAGCVPDLDPTCAYCWRSVTVELGPPPPGCCSHQRQEQELGDQAEPGGLEFGGQMRTHLRGTLGEAGPPVS